MDNLRIDFVSDASEAARNIVIDGVNLHNVAATGLAAFHPVNLFLRSPREELLGGLLGFLWGGWLQIQFLWVAEPARHRGHASRLIETAEAYASERGCTGATVETHSFQALPFYLRHGYQVFGTLDGYPPGHAKHFLRKTLEAGPAQVARPT